VYKLYDRLGETFPECFSKNASADICYRLTVFVLLFILVKLREVVKQISLLKVWFNHKILLYRVGQKTDHVRSLQLLYIIV